MNISPLAKSLIDKRIDAGLRPAEIASELAFSYSDTNFEAFVTYLGSKELLTVDSLDSEFKQTALNFYQNLSFKPKYPSRLDSYSLTQDDLMLQALADNVTEYKVLLSKKMDDMYSAKYRILYRLWIHKIETKGIELDDYSYLEQALKYRTSFLRDFKYLETSKIKDIFEAQYKQTNDSSMFSLLSSGALTIFMRDAWACQEVCKHIKTLEMNNLQLDAVLCGNRNFLAYPVEFTRECFYQALISNPSWCMESLPRWLPHDSYEVKDTPISRDALAAALIKFSEGKILRKEATLLNKIFPNFSNTIGRKKLKNQYLPKFDTAMKLKDLVSEIELVKLSAANSQSASISNEPLPEIDF